MGGEIRARRIDTRTALVGVLVVLSTVSWRRGQYFSGSLDPVVLAKAVLSGVALGLAVLDSRVRPRLRLGTGSLWFLAAVLGSSVVGALSYGTFFASVVVAVRVIVLAATMFFLLRRSGAEVVCASVAQACGLIALAGTLTGLGTVTSGRLAGGLPPLDPNELALLAAIVVLYSAWRAVLGSPHRLTGLTIVSAMGVMWATGSRTALLMLVAALVVMALHVRRARVGLVVGGLLAASAGSVAVLATGAVTAFLARNGTGTSTLDSRFVAWNASGSWASSTWQSVFGGGLSVKIISVHGQFWTSQPLDSSWISLLVQAGVLGLIVGAIWVLWVLRGVLSVPLRLRALFLPLFVFLVGRSFLESGLFDATPAFLLFVSMSLLTERGSRGRPREDDPESSTASAELPAGPGAGLLHGADAT